MTRGRNGYSPVNSISWTGSPSHPDAARAFDVRFPAVADEHRVAGYRPAISKGGLEDGRVGLTPADRDGRDNAADGGIEAESLDKPGDQAGIVGIGDDRQPVVASEVGDAFEGMRGGGDPIERQYRSATSRIGYSRPVLTAWASCRSQASCQCA
jgi:hypothetical protein